MIRTIQYLQGRPYAATLFAFTSLATFHVTTAPSYAEFRGHHTVGISWSPEKRIFSLSFGESWVSQREHERVCEELGLPASVDSLIQRMLLEDEASGA